MTDIAPWWEEPLPAEPCSRIIADSISPYGHRITTFEARFHRFVLAEVNTHTLFSRNSASSRAIPLRSKDRADGSNPRNGMLDRLEDHGIAYPIKWPKEQPGMQGADEEVDEVQAVKTTWEWAFDQAVIAAEELFDLGVHKSIINRLIEPFNWHTAVITAVDWDGFFAQRSWNHTKMAQPEFAMVATMIEDQYLSSTPREIFDGEFHTPYVRPEEEDEFSTFEKCKLSTGRCARVSYLTQDGVRDPQADFGMFDKLKDNDPPHASPFQHVATPDPANEFEYVIDPEEYGIEGYPRKTMKVPIIGNARGYMQLRHIILGM